MDDIYIADVKVGNPPQTLKMALDTGSSDLYVFSISNRERTDRLSSWVQSSDTVYRTNPEGPWAPQYMPNKSRTAHMVKDAEWMVQYGGPPLFETRRDQQIDT